MRRTQTPRNSGATADNLLNGEEGEFGDSERPLSNIELPEVDREVCSALALFKFTDECEAHFNGWKETATPCESWRRSTVRSVDVMDSGNLKHHLSATDIHLHQIGRDRSAKLRSHLQVQPTAKSAARLGDKVFSKRLGQRRRIRNASLSSESSSSSASQEEAEEVNLVDLQGPDFPLWAQKTLMHLERKKANALAKAQQLK